MLNTLSKLSSVYYADTLSILYWIPSVNYAEYSQYTILGTLSKLSSIFSVNYAEYSQYTVLGTLSILS